MSFSAVPVSGAILFCPVFANNLQVTKHLVSKEERIQHKKGGLLMARKLGRRSKFIV